MKPLVKDVAERRESLDPAPCEALAGEEAKSRLTLLLDTLPENQQEVLRLKFQAGLSYREISRVTELSVSNVGYLIHTAIKSIRQAMNVAPSTEPRPLTEPRP